MSAFDAGPKRYMHGALLLVAAVAFGCSETVAPKPSIVEVAPAAATLASVGDTIRLTATAKDAAGNAITGASVRWSSSNVSVAQVDSIGVVMARATGSAVITATVGGISGSSTVTVLPAAASVEVTPGSVEFTSLGDTARFVAIVKDASGNVIDGKRIAWSASNPGVALVDATGLVTARDNGFTTIKATADAASRSSEVRVSQVVASIEIAPKQTTLSSLAETKQLTVVMKDARGNVIVGRNPIWSSSDTSVVTVTSSGLVTAIANGGAAIVALGGAKRDTASVTVSQVAVRFGLNPASVKSWVGAAFSIPGGALDANGFPLPQQSLTWFSSDESVASITASGRITGLKAGSVTIRVARGSDTASASVVIDATASGNVLVNTELVPVVGPIHVSGNIVVPSRVTLRVASGTSVVFDGAYGISVDGMFVAIGTASDSIRFTSARAIPAAADWSGISLKAGSTPVTLDANGTYTGGSAISFAIIEYGGGVQFDGASPLFSNNRLHHHQRDRGALMACNSNAVVRDNLIEDNPARGIYIGGGSVRVQRNTIRGNGKQPLSEDGNSGGGIFIGGRNCVGAFSVAPPSGIVEDNRIVANNASFVGAGIAVGGGTTVIRNNDIKDNVLTGPPHNGAAIGVYFEDGAPQFSFNNIENNTCSTAGECAAIFITHKFTGSFASNNIVNPGVFEIYVYTGAQGGSFNASSNFWSTTSSTTLDSRIWDALDNSVLPRVMYTPMLTSRVTTAGPR